MTWQPHGGRAVLEIAQLAAAVAVVARLARGRDRATPLRAGGGRGRVAEEVSVLVPARNEEGRLGPCLAALRRDPAVAEVVVVDDESEDRTTAVASGYDVRVVAGAPLPPGWVGKSWALQQGLEAARGPWIVTLDADTRPAPGLVAAAVAAAVEHGYDLMSLTGRYECDGPLEQALHAAMLATLVYRFGPPDVRALARPARAMANGQCMVVRKDELMAAGGFAPVASHLTDDVALARHLAGVGRRVGMVDAAALLSVDMHEGVRSVWREWGRSLPMTDVTPVGQALADLATYALTTALPVTRLLAQRPTRTDLGLLLVRLLLLAALRGSYDPPRVGLLLSPLVDPLVAARLAYGTVFPTRSWRGRTYPVSPDVAATPGRGGTWRR